MQRSWSVHGKDKGCVPMQWDKSSTDPVLDAVSYKLPRPREKEVDRYNAVKISVQTSKNDWREELMIPGEHFAYREKFIKMLTEL